ncbi:pantothenate kinase [Pseudozyma hubeiensis SY62]|uniref:Pantothenate kinase n=1 Tax=Pseudozyma hubeiensis (strain SY62) TaxID=1305764 RepID=R9P8U8_PSEHS|nr:pantothenate kinase [Pseudozyma hubeiensis SY62]GAC94515.1 pantothenate kinase [Pseudozyma hubeiensis SY62]
MSASAVTLCCAVLQEVIASSSNDRAAGGETLHSVMSPFLPTTLRVRLHSFFDRSRSPRFAAAIEERSETLSTYGVDTTSEHTVSEFVILWYNVLLSCRIEPFVDADDADGRRGRRN